MASPDFFNAFNAVDAVLLAALLISVVLGALRGLVYEVMSLAGWLVAYAAAYIYSPRLPPLWSADALPTDPATGAAVMPLLSFALVFAGVLIAWNLLSHLIRLLVRATPLSGLDRLLGSFFGLARGILLLLAIAVVVALTPWAKSQPWQRSQLVPKLNEAILSIKPLLPPGLHRWMAP
ncbi:CvpA family protein [Piscinibacter sakaiensis]|uniref:CvpA family protein n=1 Tax=Piscinibacter sakaiensis TaxID=1547922 RepID=UPI003AADEF0A